MIQQLVSTPSVSCVNPAFDMSNRPVCELLAGWFEHIGAHVELMELPGSRDNVNIVATLGSGPPGLALCGHTDTVPCNEALWNVDPYSGTVRDGQLYGLGSADMKGFLALCASVAATINPGSLQRSIVFIGSADEESSMDGARFLNPGNIAMPPLCVVGEPTNMQPVHQHKGTLMERVTVKGRSGHSSNPALGANAIDGMHEVIGHLQAFRHQLEEQYQDDSFDVATPTLNFGHIKGGDNPNRICGECSLDFDLRLMPGMRVDTTRSQLRECLRAQFNGSGLTLHFDTLFEGANPLSTSTDSVLLKACEHHTGQHSTVVNFCTEAPFYQALGADTIVLGPGSIDVAHQPNECLPLHALPAMSDVLDKLIHQFCVTP